MALRKAVGAEALDLAEAALGEFARIAFRGHAGNHLVAKAADQPGALEGRHGAAKLIRFRRREARRDDGDAHRLLLKQRHAIGLAEHLLQLFGRIGDRLLAHSAAQIGMHHVALNGAGPHDRDLDDEIVEARGPEPRQHRHLRAAFDLEDAHRVGARDHRIDARVFRRDR